MSQRGGGGGSRRTTPMQQHPGSSSGGNSRRGGRTGGARSLPGAGGVIGSSAPSPAFPHAAWASAALGPTDWWGSASSSAGGGGGGSGGQQQRSRGVPPHRLVPPNPLHQPPSAETSAAAGEAAMFAAVEAEIAISREISQRQVITLSLFFLSLSYSFHPSILRCYCPAGVVPLFLILHYSSSSILHYPPSISHILSSSSYRWSSILRPQHGPLQHLRRNSDLRPTTATHAPSLHCRGCARRYGDCRRPRVHDLK